MPPVACTKCKMPLSGDVFNWRDLTPCPTCAAPLQVEIFPACFRKPIQGKAGEALLDSTEASCFYHPAKKAMVPCAACGRFLCALCDCELNGQHLCPQCLEGGRMRGKIKNLENRRVLWDSAALYLAVGPLLLFWLTVITAPVAVYFAVRHWNTPTSIIHRTKARFVIALVVAGLEIVGWIVLVCALNFHSS